MKKVKLSRLPKVTSLNELENLASENQRYQQLAIIAAQNLGGALNELEAAMRWLRTNAMETTEEGVVEEVNFCRDLVR